MQLSVPYIQVSQYLIKLFFLSILQLCFFFNDENTIGKTGITINILNS